MRRSISRRTWIVMFAALVLIGCLIKAAGSFSSAETRHIANPIAAAPAKDVGMTPTQKAEALGIKFEKLKPGYLNWCARSGKLLFTSGFSSKMEGRLGKDLTTKQG